MVKNDFFYSQTKYLEKGLVLKKIKARQKNLEDLEKRLEKAKKNREDKQNALKTFNQEANQLVQVI